MTTMADATTHRLSEMDVDEVSMVDRAANKKRDYLVVKRDTMGAQLVNKGDGTLEPKVDTPDPGTGSSNPAETVDVVETDKGKGKAAPPFPPKPDAEEEDEPSTFPSKAKEKAKADVDDLVSSLKALDIEALSKVTAALQESAKQFSPDPAEVTKAGARMAKDRYNRFKGAIDALSQILGELTPEPGPGIEASKASAEDVTGLRDKVSELSKQLADMSASRGDGNARQAEVRKSSPAGRTVVSWPRDMNDAKTRERVGKSNFWD